MFFSSGKLRFYLIVISVNLMNIMQGMMLTWPSPVLPKLISNTTLSQNPLGRIISSTEQSWIAGLLPIGGIFGPPLGGFIMQKFGRKLGIAFTHIPNIIGSLCAAFGTSIWYYYIERFAAGVALNAAVGLGAFYLGEIAENHNRGILFSSVSISINLGTLLSYCIGPYTTIRDFNLILTVISIAGLALVLLCVPESPYYLVEHNKLQEAKKSLLILKKGKNIEEEIKTIQKDLSKAQKGSILDIFRNKSSRTTFFICFIIIMLQQMSGLNVIYSYTQLIFDKVNSSLSSDVSAILVGLAQLATVPLTPLGVERFGRKTMLTISSSGLACTLGLLGTFFFLQEKTSVDTSNFNWLPILCLVLFFVSINSGVAGVPFLYMSEVIPHNVKSASSSIILTTYCIVSFLITFFFNSVVDAIGNGPSFWIFAVAMVFYAIYIALFVYETQGKSFEEINSYFRGSLPLKNNIKV